MKNIEQQIKELHEHKGEYFSGLIYASDFNMSPCRYSDVKNGSNIAQRIESDLSFTKMCNRFSSFKKRGENIES